MVIHVLRALGRRTSTVVRRMVDISNIDRDLYAGMRATSSSCWYSSVSVFDTYVLPRLEGFLFLIFSPFPE